MNPEPNWTLTTWEGSRRQQHRDFLALSFRQKLEIIEQLGEVATFFTAWRTAWGLPVRLPAGSPKD
jgi:hypothetical protein